MTVKPAPSVLQSYVSYVQPAMILSFRLLTPNSRKRPECKYHILVRHTTPWVKANRKIAKIQQHSKNTFHVGLPLSSCSNQVQNVERPIFYAFVGLLFPSIHNLRTLKSLSCVLGTNWATLAGHFNMRYQRYMTQDSSGGSAAGNALSALNQRIDVLVYFSCVRLVLMKIAHSFC